ncbi:hypothetical protein CHARACLAT_021903, partial [Characodon lateralis]|nr:hypothetical protein [Characodon lateralis]
MHRAWILFFLIEEGFALAQRTKDSPGNPGGQGPNQNDCGTWVRNINGGVFMSPNYPNTYPPNKECVYILEGGGVVSVGRSWDSRASSIPACQRTACRKEPGDSARMPQ